MKQNGLRPNSKHALTKLLKIHRLEIHRLSHKIGSGGFAGIQKCPILSDIIGQVRGHSCHDSSVAADKELNLLKSMKRPLKLCI